MLCKSGPRCAQPRRATAAVEMAVVAPFLFFLFIMAVDWGRIFYYSVTISNCALNGAAYKFDAYNNVNSPYTSVTDAALADAGNITPTPTVTSASGSDTDGAYFECTVKYDFKTITNFPGITKTTTITRTVRVYTAPQKPQ